MLDVSETLRYFEHLRNFFIIFWPLVSHWSFYWQRLNIQLIHLEYFLFILSFFRSCLLWRCLGKLEFWLIQFYRFHIYECSPEQEARLANWNSVQRVWFPSSCEHGLEWQRLFQGVEAMLSDIWAAVSWRTMPAPTTDGLLSINVILYS